MINCFVFKRTSVIEWTFYDERRRKKVLEFKIKFLNETYTHKHIQVTGFNFFTEWMAMGSQHKS